MISFHIYYSSNSAHSNIQYAECQLLGDFHAPDIHTKQTVMYRIPKVVLTEGASGQRVDSKSKGFQLRLNAPTETRLRC